MFKDIIAHVRADCRIYIQKQKEKAKLSSALLFQMPAVK